MTKIKETIHWDDMAGKMIVQETHNFTPVMERAKALKSAGLDNFGNDNKLIGVVPGKMLEIWAKKWGVKFSDHQAMEAVIAKELNDPDNAYFRVWDGKL